MVAPHHSQGLFPRFLSPEVEERPVISKRPWRDRLMDWVTLPAVAALLVYLIGLDWWHRRNARE